MRCPFCREEIQDGALKCRFCNEWLGAPVGPKPSDGGAPGYADYPKRSANRQSNALALPAVILVAVLRFWVAYDRFERSQPPQPVQQFPPTYYRTVNGKLVPISSAHINDGIFDFTQNVFLNTTTTLPDQCVSFNGFPLIYTMKTWPAHGKLDGTIGVRASRCTYTPNPGYAGKDSFTFNFDDGHGDSGTSQATLNVLSSTPIAVEHTYDVAENGSLEIRGPQGLMALNQHNLFPIKLARDRSDSQKALNGKLSFHPDGSFEYVPQPGFTGQDWFAYRVTDAKENTSDPGDINLVVEAPPSVEGQNVTMQQGGISQVALSATNESDDQLTYNLVTWPAHGTISDFSGDNLVYTPKPNFSGQDSFTFKASNDAATSLPAKVSITVTPTPSVTAADHYYLTPQNAALRVNAGLGILAGTAGTAPPFTATTEMQPVFGKLTLGKQGDFVFTPRPGFAGRDGFTYRARDSSSLESAPSMAVIDVEGEPQVTDNQAFTAEMGKRLALRLAASDPCQAPLTYKIVSRPRHGVLRGAAPNLIYRPAPGYRGPDQFRWVASNSLKTSSAASISILVQRTLPTVLPFHLTVKAAQPATVLIGGKSGESLTVPAQFGQSGTYLFNFANDGASPANFAFHGPASSDGYTFAYFNSPAGGGDITTQVTSPAGWVTPAVLPGKPFGIRAQITVTDGAWHDGQFAFKASSPRGRNPRSVQLKFTLPQHIAKVCYSYDSGQHWTDVPPSGIIPIAAYRGLTLKAFRSNPNQPWPGSFDLLNWWDTTSTTTSSEGPNTNFFGDQLTLEYTAPTPARLNDVTRRNELKVVGGNTIHLYPVVYPDLSLDLESSNDTRTGSEPGNHSTPMTGSVTDVDGQPVAGVRLNFSTTAGTFEETGKSTASCNSNSQGKAVVTLVAGAAKEQATVTAQVNDAPLGTLTQTASVGFR